MMTADTEWSPTLLDNIISDNASWITNVNQVNPGHSKSFDHFGDYQHRTVSTHHTSTQQATIVDDLQFFDPTGTSDPDPFFFDADTPLNGNTDENIRLCMELEVTPNNVTIASPTTTSKSTPDYLLSDHTLHGFHQILYNSHSNIPPNMPDRQLVPL